jgi:hypothetical protein
MDGSGISFDARFLWLHVQVPFLVDKSRLLASTNYLHPKATFITSSEAIILQVLLLPFFGVDEKITVLACPLPLTKYFSCKKLQYVPQKALTEVLSTVTIYSLQNLVPTVFPVLIIGSYMPVD